MTRTDSILFVSEKFPWPVDDGGQTRTYHVLAQLARVRPTALVAHAPTDASGIARIEALGVDVACRGERSKRWAAPAWAAFSTLTRAPYPMRKNRSRAMLAEIRRRIESGRVGVVHFNHLDSAQYVESLGALRDKVTCVFDTHNVLTTMYQRFHETARDPLKRAFLGLQWTKMSRFEREIMRRMDRVLVCSEIERELLFTWGIDAALVVPNGVDVDYFTPRTADTVNRSPLIVFTGAMAYEPNADAVRWFLDAILPLVRARVPNVLFRVVGKDPPADLLARAIVGEIEFTGRVDDVRPHMNAADVFVCPLRIGGGTRLKILDAMSQALPVVSTTVGAEGLAVSKGLNIVLADDPRAFSDAVLALLSDKASAGRLAQAGLMLVRSRYSWEAVTRGLVNALERN
ncbi:MAG: glycosyltransferase family 4 protein [Planctomycetota bacterium]|nr:glycosyltransferase family 4 protein [Planctomycetota bacterium]